MKRTTTQERQKMRNAAVFLGEPACEVVRGLLDELDAISRAAPDRFMEIRAFVADPEANGGLSTLQDCGLDMLREVLAEIDAMQPVVDAALDLEGPDTHATQWNALGRAVVSYTATCPHGGPPEKCLGEDCDGAGEPPEGT